MNDEEKASPTGGMTVQDEEMGVHLFLLVKSSLTCPVSCVGFAVCSVLIIHTIILRNKSLADMSRV